MMQVLTGQTMLWTPLCSRWAKNPKVCSSSPSHKANLKLLDSAVLMRHTKAVAGILRVADSVLCVPNQVTQARMRPALHSVHLQPLVVIMKGSTLFILP